MDKILVAALNRGPVQPPTIDLLRKEGTRGLNRVRPFVRGLVDGLRKLGHQPGVSFDIDYVEDKPNRLKKTIQSVLTPETKVIFPIAFHALEAAKTVSKKTAIIFPNISDPVEDGAVKSTAHPRTNATGIRLMRRQTAPDCLELFKAMVPSLKTVYTLYTKRTRPAKAAIRDLRKLAPKVGIDFKPIPMTNPDDLKTPLAPLKQKGAKGKPRVGFLFVPDDVVMSKGNDIIPILHAKGIPTFSYVVEFVHQTPEKSLGGYGVPQKVAGNAAADYVDKVLKGADPALLPVKMMGGFKWLINTGVAATLNIKIPPAIKAAAD